MTGVAIWHPNTERPFIDEGNFVTTAELVERACTAYHKISIGWEQFTINAQTHKKTADASEAIQVIGAIRSAAVRHNRTILTPAQQHTPSPLDRQRLEAIGWWVPAKNDAQSAAAHLLNWMLRTNQVPPREAAILADLRSRSGEQE
jgi:hypothetical protein